jgi:hypothetical protein
MKPRTYFGLALLFPYILWGICALIVFLLSSKEISEAWNIVLMPLMFYVFGIILWLVPYTVLAVAMWIWSRNKSTTALYRLALIAPILLFALMFIEVVLVSLPVETGGIDKRPTRSIRTRWRFQPGLRLFVRGNWAGYIQIPEVEESDRRCNITAAIRGFRTSTHQISGV